MFDQNIPRWIIASVNKHFQDNRQNINLYFNNDIRDDPYWAELRFSGPNIDQYTRDCFRINCIINILLTAFIDQDDYIMYRMIGVFSQAFTPICVYKFGDGPNDDQSLFGTLTLIGGIDTINYGFVTTESKHKKSTLEASYLMYL